MAIGSICVYDEFRLTVACMRNMVTHRRDHVCPKRSAKSAEQGPTSSDLFLGSNRSRRGAPYKLLADFILGTLHLLALYAGAMDGGGVLQLLLCSGAIRATYPSTKRDRTFK